MDDPNLIRKRYMADMILPDYTDTETLETLHLLEDLKREHKFSEALQVASQLMSDITKDVDLNTFPLFFETPFQKDLYELRHPEYKHTEPDKPLFQILYTLGSLLIECDYPAAAKPILRRAWDLAPYSSTAALEYIESLKALGEWDEAEKATIEALRFTIDKAKIAHLFRDLGFINIERGEYEIAAFLYVNSMTYENVPTAHHELDYIADKVPEKPSEAAFEAYVSKYNIPVIPELSILQEIIKEDSKAEEVFNELMEKEDQSSE